MKVSQGKVQRAQKVVVYGPEGIGKTTLASRFPDPLFIDTEGGTNHLDVRRADPSPTSWTMLMGYVSEVASDPSLCSTLVIDTADWAERLCIEHVLAAHNAKGVEDFGYGKGYTYVKEEFGRLLDRLTDVVGAGVNVVVTAHAQIRKFEQPDELGAYDRWELKLTRQTAPLLKEWSDMLLFCNYETIVVRPDKKDGGHAKAQGGKRVMYTDHSAAWDAKNRCGLPPKLDMDFAQISHYIPDMRQTAGPVSEPEPEPEPASAPDHPAPEGAPVVLSDGLEAAVKAHPHLAPLADLMVSRGISEGALQAHCGREGYCTSDTPVSMYPTDFAGYLVSAFDDVCAEIARAEENIPFN